MNACTEPFLIVYSILSGFISNISRSSPLLLSARPIRITSYSFFIWFFVKAGSFFVSFRIRAHRIHGRRQILLPFCIHSISKWKCQIKRRTSFQLDIDWAFVCTLYILCIDVYYVVFDVAGIRELEEYETWERWRRIKRQICWEKKCQWQNNNSNSNSNNNDKKIIHQIWRESKWTESNMVAFNVYVSEYQAAAVEYCSKSKLYEILNIMLFIIQNEKFVALPIQNARW